MVTQDLDICAAITTSNLSSLRLAFAITLISYVIISIMKTKKTLFCHLNFGAWSEIEELSR